MNRTALLPLLLAATSLATGCFLLPGSELSEVLPDDRIEVNLPIASTLAKDDTREWSTYYLWTAEVTENVNRMTGVVLYWVDTITSDYRPSYVNDDRSEAIWGPWSEGPLDPNETQLRVQHDLETDAYAWGFERWAKDAGEEALVTVVDGEIDPGATREVSTGRFTVDFTTINAMDPTEEATGIYAVDYDIGTEGVSAVASFEDFGPTGLEADYAYQQTFGGEGAMDIVLVTDLNPAWGLGLDETIAMHSRWLADGSGRGDVRVSGGDLGDEVGYATECWSSSFERVYFLDEYSGEEEGDPALCAYPEAEYPVAAE
ncbi:MAG: hypothetical protein ABIO70_03895 [Pseudomonadota bacterium]